MISATRLFVGNLPENTQENELHKAFSVFGEITNLDLKCKPGDTNESKKFAFVSISAGNSDVESCIKHFSQENFKGNRLYVTRARESFLERLQRERQLAQVKESGKGVQEEHLPKKNPILKLSDKLNPRKRKIEVNHINEGNRIRRHSKDDPLANETSLNDHKHKIKRNLKDSKHNDAGDATDGKNLSIVTEADKKKHEAEKKRLESMKKKRQEFKEKQMIIKTGLTGVDKAKNKKVIFSDYEDEIPNGRTENNSNKTKRKGNQNTLFEDDGDESDDGLNFEVKKQFEGKKGQKVLDLQSRYKSDKRFTLDERFIDDDEEEETNPRQDYNTEEVELGTADEKAKQMNILQDVLGVTIKQKYTDNDNKNKKPKLGMLRFDPLQPDHAKFLAPVEPKPEPTKKSKKKAKEKQEDIQEQQIEPEGPKVEVSKEQFYKVSDALKEAIAQPSSFSLRSLFGSKENDDDGVQEQETDYIPLEAPKAKKVKNPLDPKEKNPFVYDSSDSETEEPETKEVKPEQLPAPAIETKAVWKENLFFSTFDIRLKDGLSFFSKAPETEIQKERRELKSLMKKRIYNNDRKNQMFKKKIGGKKKSMKKTYKNKS